jgi:hypothetical protein
MHSDKYSNQINKIIKVLKTATISSNDYNSTNEPFFNNDIHNIEFKINFEKIDESKIPSSLNRNIILIYKILGNTATEIYLKDWTLFSLDKALELYNDYCEKGQTNIFDIGFKYMGMGHVDVISCDLESHLLFFRPDGGSNGYEREIHYNSLIKDGSTPYKKFIFTKWFYEI